MVPLDVLNDLRKFLKFKMQSYSGLTVDGKAINCLAPNRHDKTPSYTGGK